MELIAAILIALVLAFVALTVLWKRRNRIPPAEAEKIRGILRAAAAQADPHRQVLDAEKALDRALRLKGFGGSFGEMLKKAGSGLPNREAVWAAHKLRNRIAPEPDVSVTPAQARGALAAFEKAVRSLL